MSLTDIQAKAENFFPRPINFWLTGAALLDYIPSSESHLVKGINIGFSDCRWSILVDFHSSDVTIYGIIKFPLVKSIS